MRTETITLYRFDELSEEARARAIKDFRDSSMSDEIPWQEEIFDSLRELFKQTIGVELSDWQLGLHGRSYLKSCWYSDEAENLTGPRAMAWLENNLFSKLRIPWTGEERWTLAKYGEWYRPEMIKPCPLTGVCYDEDFLGDLRQSIRDGMTLKEAFNGLDDTYARLLEQAEEDYYSDESISETLEINEYEFTETGDRA